MTRRERASQCAHEICRRDDQVLPADIDIIEQAITAAIEEERATFAQRLIESSEELTARLEAGHRAAVKAAIEEQRAALLKIAEDERGISLEVHGDFNSGYLSALGFMIHHIRARSNDTLTSQPDPSKS